MKRRLREIFRRLRGRFQFPIEFVAIALAGSTELEYKELEGEVVFGLIKAGVLKPSRRPTPGARR